LQGVGILAEEKPNDEKKPEEVASEEEDVLSLLDELLAEATSDNDESDDKAPNDPKKPADAEEPIIRRRGQAITDDLPPIDFLDFLYTQKRREIKSANWPVVWEYVYEKAREGKRPSLRQAQAELNMAYTTIHRAVTRLRGLWAMYKKEYEAWKARKEAAEAEPAEESPAPAQKPVPHFEPTAEPDPAPAKKNKSKKSSKGGGSTETEKDAKWRYEFDTKTNIFKEVDKTLAKAFGAQFHRYALERDIYARLGELLIFSLLQLGVVERDKIVAYSEKLSEDPNALYEYVKTQLDAVLRITDPETLTKTWQENLALRNKVRALEASVDLLAEQLSFIKHMYNVALHLLDDEAYEVYVLYSYLVSALKEVGIDLTKMDVTEALALAKGDVAKLLAYMNPFGLGGGAFGSRTD